MVEWSAGNLQGLIPLLGGIYGLLLGKGSLPAKPRNQEKLEAWRARLGPMMKWLCPAVMLFGILQLLGVL